MGPRQSIFHNRQMIQVFTEGELCRLFTVSRSTHEKHYLTPRVTVNSNLLWFNNNLIPVQYRYFVTVVFSQQGFTVI